MAEYLKNGNDMLLSTQNAVECFVIKSRSDNTAHGLETLLYSVHSQEILKKTFCYFRTRITIVNCEQQLLDFQNNNCQTVEKKSLK